MGKIKVGLYGLRGHQIHPLFLKPEPHPLAQLTAVAGFGDKQMPEGVRAYETLDELLADPEVELVSLCSPFRSMQAADAAKALNAKKHVYAEKPVAMTARELDAIIKAAKTNERHFHEMGGVQFQQPYKTMHEIVKSGVLGEIIQIHGQKCYPWTERRPTDENVDGGLAMQVGIYLTRFVEHVACQKISALTLQETKHGNPVAGHNCRMAVTMQMKLANGGLASGIANYLNPMGDKVWGYEILRIFGTQGLVESNPEEKTVRVVIQNKPPQIIDAKSGSESYFDMFLRTLLGTDTMPMSLEDELSPTRWIIHAREPMM
jgi:predicted dehydrogenase